MCSNGAFRAFERAGDVFFSRFSVKRNYFPGETRRFSTFFVRGKDGSGFFCVLACFTRFERVSRSHGAFRAFERATDVFFEALFVQRNYSPRRHAPFSPPKNNFRTTTAFFVFPAPRFVLFFVFWELNGTFGCARARPRSHERTSLFVGRH